MKQIVNKLRIISFPKGDFGAGGAPVKTAESGATGGGMFFEVQINPENFKRTFSIKHHCANAKGNSGATTQFSHIAPDKLSLKFTIDGTGVVANSSALPDPVQMKSDMEGRLSSSLPGSAQAVSGTVGSSAFDTNITYVPLKVLQLKATVFKFSGARHRTPFIMVIWGKEIFKGVLNNLDVTYTLFHPSGIPLRAEVSMTVTQHTDQPTMQALMNLLSPDLTHERTVHDSDTILTLTKSIYDSPMHYLEVAKANRLNNFRRLVPGSKLHFPPINKKE